MVGDASAHIVENRRRCFAALGRDVNSLYDCWLVHGTEAVRVEQPRGEAEYRKADILLTDHPEITLFMRYADCVPIMLVDPVRRVIGLAHAGWMGTVNGLQAWQLIVWSIGIVRSGGYSGVIGPSICVSSLPGGPRGLRRYCGIWCTMRMIFSIGRVSRNISTYGKPTGGYLRRLASSKSS